VLAHMAMLDVFYVTLMLLGFLFYLKHRYVLCGVTMGLSLLCKETALFGIIAIILHWIIIHRSEIAEDIRYTWLFLRSKDVLQFRTNEILDFARIPVIITGMWVLLLPLLEWAKTPLWGMLFTRTWYLVWKNLMYSGMGQGNGAIAPIHTWAIFFQQHLQNFNFVSGRPRYIDAVSFSIWALLIPVIIYLLYQTFRDLRHGQKHSIAAFALCWFLPVYGLFIIIDILVKRPMYDFYIYAAVPAVCLAIALGWWQLWALTQGHKKLTIIFHSILILFILATLASFIIMSPLGSNLVTLPLTV